MHAAAALEWMILQNAMPQLPVNSQQMHTSVCSHHWTYPVQCSLCRMLGKSVMARTSAQTRAIALGVEQAMLAVDLHTKRVTPLNAFPFQRMSSPSMPAHGSALHLWQPSTTCTRRQKQRRGQLHGRCSAPQTAMAKMNARAMTSALVSKQSSSSALTSRSAPRLRSLAMPRALPRIACSLNGRSGRFLIALGCAIEPERSRRRMSATASPAWVPSPRPRLANLVVPRRWTARRVIGVIGPHAMIGANVNDLAQCRLPQGMAAHHATLRLRKQTSTAFTAEILWTAKWVHGLSGVAAVRLAIKGSSSA
mmetsp:Transcript_46404/g.110535  ORF Transcript_46404/g.110535 Transcript_46404/m.110535 type:complete len:308 (+) Transcript_46404:477-1400(+)